MVKKITGGDGKPAKGKQLQAKRLKLKHLHKHVAGERDELSGLPADELPAASASNAARQARSKLENTFPVDWFELHTEKKTDETNEDDES